MVRDPPILDLNMYGQAMGMGHTTFACKDVTMDSLPEFLSVWTETGLDAGSRLYFCTLDHSWQEYNLSPSFRQGGCWDGFFFLPLSFHIHSRKQWRKKLMLIMP